jgi:hypothetical protein
MKAFFVGGRSRHPASRGTSASLRVGITDNRELDLDCRRAPAHYPDHTGAGVPRYRLHACVERDGQPLYAVYAPPEMAADEVDRIVAERRYPARFEPGHAPG